LGSPLFRASILHMRGTAIILSGLLLAATACRPAMEETTAVAEAPAPLETSDGGPRTPEPAEVFPVPAGTACAIRGGWSIDRDPAGLKVRAAPSERAAVLGRLPRAKFSPADDRVLYTVFDIIEVRDGWVRIGNPVAPDDYFAEGPPRTKLPSGWISGRHVAFEIQGDKAFAQPDPASPVIASRWTTPTGGEHPMRYRHLLDCRGEWVKMLFTDHQSREREGWARGVCNSLETSCDGDGGDTFRPDEKRPSGPDYKPGPSIRDR
jgi:hypothetical protein